MIIRQTKTIYFAHPSLKYIGSDVKCFSGIWTYRQLKKDFGWDVEPLLSNPIECIHIKNSTKSVQCVEINKDTDKYINGVLISRPEDSKDMRYSLIIPAYQQKVVHLMQLDVIFNSIGIMLRDDYNNHSLKFADNFREYIPDIIIDVIANVELKQLNLLPKQDDELTFVKIYF